MTFLALINPRIWVALALAAALTGLGWWTYNAVYDRGAASVQKKWEAEKLVLAQASAKVATDALATTKTLAKTIETQRSDFNAQISGVTAVAARAVAGLSNRPARDSAGDLPRDPGDGKTSIGCTGAQLYKDDSEFLTRLAGESDKLRISLKACYAQYDAAKKTVSAN